MSIIASKFGLMMRQARENAGLSQEELAKKLDISRISIANYEGGKQCPSLDAAVVIADELKLSLDELGRNVKQAGLRSSLNQVADPNLRHQLEDVLAQATGKKGDG